MHGKPPTWLETCRTVITYRPDRHDGLEFVSAIISFGVSKPSLSTIPVGISAVVTAERRAVGPRPGNRPGRVGLGPGPQTRQPSCSHMWRDRCVQPGLRDHLHFPKCGGFVSSITSRLKDVKCCSSDQKGFANSENGVIDKAQRISRRSKTCASSTSKQSADPLLTSLSLQG